MPHFTPPQVDEVIPKLETLFRHIRQYKSRAETLTAEVLRNREQTDNVMLAHLQVQKSQIQYLLAGIQEDLNEITRMGGVPKDLDAGLVDFPGNVDGREVWLCWKSGEKTVRYWHALDSGFGARRMLPQEVNRAY